MALWTGLMKPENWDLRRLSQNPCSIVHWQEADKGELTDDGLIDIEGAGSHINGRNHVKQAKKTSSQTTYTKAPAAKLPRLNLEMIPQQFRKFRIDWDVFFQNNEHAEISSQCPRIQLHWWGRAKCYSQHPRWFLHHWPRRSTWDDKSIVHSEIEPHRPSSYFCLYVAKRKSAETKLSRLPQGNGPGLRLLMSPMWAWPIGHVHQRPIYCPWLEPLNLLGRTSTMQKHLNQHYETKIQRPSPQT